MDACYRFRLDCSYSLVLASAVGFPLLPPHFSPVLDRGTGACARDSRQLQQLDINVHVKHSDLTCRNNKRLHISKRVHGYMASDIWQSTTEIAREDTRCRHMGYSFRLAARCFYMHHPTDRITHTTAFVTPVVQHWLERDLAQWVHHEGSIRRPMAP